MYAPTMYVGIVNELMQVVCNIWPSYDYGQVELLTQLGEQRNYEKIIKTKKVLDNNCPRTKSMATYTTL